MNRTAWPLFAICALSIIGIVVLSVTANPVPAVLETIALASLTGAAGVTIPTTNPATTVSAGVAPGPLPPGPTAPAADAALAAIEAASAHLKMMVGSGSPPGA